MLMFNAVVCGSHEVATSPRDGIRASVSLLQKEQAENILADFPEHFFLEKVVVTANVLIDQEELLSLIGLQPKTIIAKKDLIAAIDACSKKQKFDKLNLSLAPDGSGYTLNMDLEGLWTLARVQFRGSMVGKERYRQYYPTEPGELFDENKKERALEKIRRALKDESYLNARVVAELVKDQATKSLTVVITIEPGKRFLINNVHVCVRKDPDDGGQDDCAAVAVRAKKLLKHELRKGFYTKELIDTAARSVRQYLVRKGYLDAAIEYQEEIDRDEHTVRLNFVITLYNRKIFEFVGNTFFTSETLIKEIMQFGKAAMMIPPALLAEDIERLYKDKGFWQIKVSWQEEPNRDFFIINEGPRAIIDEVAVVGANAFASKDFARHYFNYFLRGNFFDADILKEGSEKLTQWYLKAGYWDVVVGAYSYQALSTPGHYRLTIPVQEGPQRLLKKMEAGDFEDVFKNSPFASYFSLKKPIPFAVNLVPEVRQWLLKELQSRGILYASAKPMITEETDGATVVWRADGSLEPVRFGKTVIVGTSHLPSSIIMRELQYMQGDVWDKEKIDYSLTRLRSLGIFDTISLSPAQLAEQEAFKTMYVRYLEDEPFEVRLRGGAAIQSKNLTFREGATYMAGGSFVWKNPTNRADKLLFNTDFTRFRRDLALRYIMPWFFHWPLKTELKGYSNRYDQPIILGAAQNLYTITQDGFLLSLSYTARRWQFGVDSGIEWMELSGLSRGVACAIQFEPRLIDKKIPYYFVEPSIFYDNLDDKINPTRGTFSLLTLKSMIPFDLNQGFFVKIQAEQSLFFPLASRAVLALRLRAGYIFEEQFTRIMPTERFYLGGGQTLRGYDADFAPPLGVFKDCHGECHLAPIGGRSMINGNVELRLPLMSNFSVVLFTDMGFLTQDGFSAICAQNILGASGFGLRYHTPVGPVRFDIGWKWRKSYPDDRAFAWFLTLGQAF